MIRPPHLGLHLDDANAGMPASDREVVDAAKGPLAALLKRYEASRAAGAFPELPPTLTKTTQAFVRNPLVVSIAKKRAGFECEIPDCSTVKFEVEGGGFYCEVHHIVPLADGGKDVIENAICLCALHHREAHFGQHRPELTRQMLQVRAAASESTVKC